jgi:CBS domain-containing protein
MSIGELCSRIVVVADRKTTSREAALLIRQHHVGDVVVVEKTEGGNAPVGIVTDRDIVVEVVANQLDSDTVSLGDIMVEGLVTVPESADIFATMQLLQRNGIRRAPVVDDKGVLAGIIAVDDLVQFLAEELGELSRLIEHEQAHEVRIRK